MDRLRNILRVARRRILPLVFVVFTACQNGDETVREQLYRQHARGEYILRHAEDTAFPLPEPKVQPPPTYPWR
jgi:hypothetical protein